MIADKIEDLKKEVDFILVRYSVPLDDRMLILEKIEQSTQNLLESQGKNFDEIVNKIRSDIGKERKGVIRKIEEIRNSAASKVSDISGKVKEAYDQGLSDGADSTSTSPGLFQIMIGIGLLALSAFVILQGRK
jgi:gas vesicle protein